jgi:hypothetical protein
MNKFFRALTTKDKLTENGMPTHSTSGSFVVDLFYAMGGFRSNAGKSLGELVGLFYAALGENPNLAVKCLLNLRDPRGGMGERLSGRILWNALAKSHPELVKKLYRRIPEFGRWDDILALLDTPVEEEVLAFILESLVKGDKLCAKWMPRENKKHGDIAKYMAERWGMDNKEYRHLVAQNTEVVENLMCQSAWEKVVFRSVPSQAMKRYRKAFNKHQEERFSAFLEKVNKGEEKINTSVLSPVDIVHEYLSKGFTRDETLETLWKNLKDVVPENIAFLPICDVSGSMNGTPMEVSLSLGVYLAQRNKSIFKNAVITFSQNPTFVHFVGKDLISDLQFLRRIDWGMNTNLEAVFRLILSQAVKHNLSQVDLPTHLMIISDMQFDQCVGSAVGYSVKEKFSNTALEMVDRMYSQAGYKRPNIFFWNVRTSEGIPAKVDDGGVGLVSGYSPNLLRSILSGDLNPLSQVLAILNNGRYDFVNDIV